MKVRVKSCGHPWSWYKDRIGSVYTVIATASVAGTANYVVHDGEMGEGYLWCEDAEEIKQSDPLLTGTPDYYTLNINGPADFYLIADACGQPDLALWHASKKLMFAGKRGAKEKVQDVQEARDALSRWLQIQEMKKP